LLLSIAISFMGAAFYCGAYGITIERIGYRPLRHSPRLSPLISAIGMSIFLQNYVMLTQGSTDKVFPATISSAGINVFGASITFIQLVLLIISVILMSCLHLFVKKTKIGKAMRATAQDKKMASLLGIDIDRLITLTFIVGSVLAAAAGIMAAIYYGVVNFNIGNGAGIKAFTAAVLGGIGSIPGAMLGGLLLGLLESLCSAYISSAYKDLFAFMILILVLILRPSGLIGKTVTEKP
ncbi:MAG: branched-chain amino acid ABC transporter permease, partial [Nitrospirota bacterium]